MSYSKWIGKKVYVSDYSLEEAERCKKMKDDSQLGILDSVDFSKAYPFYVRMPRNIDGNYEYAVLAEEESEELVPGDRVRVKDNDDDKDRTEPYIFPYIFIGKIAGKYAVVNEEDDYDAFIRGDIQTYVSLWDCAEKVQPVKNITLEEALAKLEEVFGQPVEIKEVQE